MEEGVPPNIVDYISKRYNCVPVGLIGVVESVPAVKILNYANRKDWAFDVAQLKLQQNKPATISILPQNICWLLANSFMGNVVGNLHWKLLFESSNNMAKQRLLCICDYFNRFETRPNQNEPVIITRAQLSNNLSTYNDIVIDGSNVVVHIDNMESVAGAFVDFANRNLHIGRIIPSLTQEEVLFSMCSECFISILCVEELLDDECIIFENVWRHSTYTGYSESFKWSGHANEITEILAMDATMHNQFDLIERDLNKAYLAFSNAKSNIISTGKWGCGVFGGDVTLKFLQQIMASQLANKKMIFYSAFKSEGEKNAYTNLLYLIKMKKPTMRWLISEAKEFQGYDFYLHICDAMNEL